MKEELQTQLASSLNQLMGLVKDGATWAKSEIPLVVQEKITLGQMWETSLIISLVIAAVISGCLIRFFIKKKQADSRSDWEVGIVLSSIVTVGLFFVCIAQLHNVLLVWFAPRVYILNWIASLTR